MGTAAGIATKDTPSQVRRWDRSGLKPVVALLSAVLMALAGLVAVASPAHAVIIPGTPGTPTAAAGNGGVLVTVSAPTTGDVPDYYTVTATPGGQSCTAVKPTTLASPATGTAPTTCMVFGLTNGTSHSFRVTATNSAGTSAASAAVTATPNPGNGPVVLNGDGGTNASNGIRTIYRAGNTQVVRLNQGQFYNPNALPTATGGLYNAISLAVGDSTSSGTLFRNQAVTTVGSGMSTKVWNSVVTTGGSNGAGSFTTVLTGTTTIAPALTYTVTVTGTYSANNDYVTFNYSVNVPGGNTKTVRLFTAYDSYLGGADTGPGFVTYSISGSPSVVGVQKAGVQEAIRYRSGPVWSSYTSQVYNNAIGVPGAASFGPGYGKEWNNTIDANAATDNGFGTSWNFGTAAGTYTAAADLIVGSGIILGAPGKPTGVTAVAGAGAATVSWTPPVDPGTSAITGYQVTSSPGGLTCTANAPATTCAVTGLTSGTSYTFTVVAVNGSGPGPASDPSNAVTPTAPPAAPAVPGKPTAVAGNGAVTVTITPAAGGTAPLSYRVTSVGGAGNCTITVPATSCVVTPLTNGTAYTFTSTASNGGGTSAASVASDPVTPMAPALTPAFGPVTRTAGGFTTLITNYDSAFTWGAAATAGATASVNGAGLLTVSGLPLNTASTATITTARTGYVGGTAPVTGTSADVPGAPTDLVATPGDGAASIAFAAPGSDGGSPLTNYEYSLNGGPWLPRSPAAVTSPIAITGLTNGLAYNVALRAVNAAGPGAPSAPVAVTPAAAALTPTFGPVVRTVGGFTTQITNYDPLFTWNGSATAGGSVAISGTGLVTVTGLALNTASTATITTARAGHEGGTAPVSGTSLDVPGAPTGLIATPGAGAASIAFDAPGSDGGSAITTYEYSLDGGATWVPRSPAGVTSPLALTGLINGTEYTVTMRAVNAAGAGPASAPVVVTPIGVALTPEFGPVTRTVGGFTTLITNYDSSFAWNGSATAGGSVAINGAGLVTVTGLGLNTPATATITTTRAGYPDGSATVDGTSLDVPGAPTGLVATPGDGTASVVFDAPATDGGSAITTYQYSIDDGATWAPRVPAGVASPLDLTGLTNGTSYDVRLRAVNVAGPGAPSVATAVTPMAPALTPNFGPTTRTAGGFTAQITNFDPAFTWNGSATDGGSVAVSGTGLVTVTGLALNTEATATITTTRAGFIGGSAPVTGTSLDVPGAPTGLIPTPGSGEAAVVFTAPVSDGGAPITTYQYSTDDGVTWTPRSPSGVTSPVLISGLTNGTAYDVRLRAVNAAGPGAASLPVAVTPIGAALTPTFGAITRTVGGFTAPITNFDADFTWNGSATAGGSVSVSGTGMVTVTGVGLNTPSTATITTTRAGYPVGSAPVTGTSLDVPGAPTGLNATPGDGSASVAFDAPASDGGSAITTYEYSLNGGLTWVPRSPDGVTSPLEITGLTNGTSYSVVMRAVNIAGAGGQSTPTVVTPIGAALTPTFGPVTRTAGGFTAQITNFDPLFTWNGSATAGGSVGVSGTGLVTVTGLGFNTPSTATITTTRPGYQSGSGTVTGTSLDVPGAPTGLVATPGPTVASIAFSAPASDGGSAVTTYEYSLNGGATWVARTPAAVTSPLSISGLTNGATYNVRLRALNVAGPGPSSGPVTVKPQAIPTAPKAPTVTGSTFSWSAPAWTATPTVTGYSVFYKKWADRNNAAVKWGVYAMKRPGGWAAGTAPATVQLNATKNACGAANLAAGFNYCPLPYGNLTDHVNGYAMVTLAQQGTVLGQYSPVVRYIP